MNKNPTPIATPADSLNALIIDAIQDLKGKDIILFDLRQFKDANIDYFIICHGTSNTQTASILKSIERRVLSDLGIRANHSEGGVLGAGWFLIDYFSVIVHVFSKEKRDFYNLEDLWSDAKITKYENID